jgi:hypothetical protein
MAARSIKDVIAGGRLKRFMDRRLISALSHPLREQVEARQRRGATEHFFQAKPAMYFNDRAWEIIPGSVRSDMTVSQIQSIFGDVAGAIRMGVFGASGATHVTWLPSVFDKAGWQEAMTLMNKTLAGMMTIQERSRERIALSGDVGILGTIVLLGFESC